MNLNICSLHKIPELGSESAAYIAQDAAAQDIVSHDGINRVFMRTHELETDAIRAYEIDLSLDERALFMANLLVNEHPPIHDYQHNLSALYRHPMHRVWCAKYDDRDLFVSDWAYIKNMIAEYMPEAAGSWPEMSDSLTYADGREIIFNAVSQNAGD